MTWNQLSTWNSIGAVGPAATISAVSSSNGADTATAFGTLTITVDDSTGVTAVTVGGISCTSVATPTGTSVTCTAPKAFGDNYGTLRDVVVTNGTGPSTGYEVTTHIPTGMTETDFTVAYAGLSVDSPFYGDAAYSAIVALPSPDSCVYESVTTPDGHSVTMSGDGEFTIGGTVTAQQTFDFYIFDDSDNTGGTTGTITVILTEFSTIKHIITSWKADVQSTNNTYIDYSLSISTSTNIVIGTVSTIINNTQFNVENSFYINSLNRDLVIEIANNAIVERVLPLAHANLLEVDCTPSIEWSGTAVFNADTILLIDWTSIIQKSLSISTEQISSLSIENTNVTSWAIDLTSGNLIEVEFGSQLASSDVLLLDVASNLTGLREVKVGWALDLEKNCLVPIDQLNKLSADTYLPIEWQGIVASSITTDAILLIDWAADVTSILSQQLEYYSNLVVSETIRLEYEISILSDTSSSIEYSTGIFSEDATTVEWSSNLGADNSLKISFKGYLSKEVIYKVEHSYDVGTLITNPIDWLTYVGVPKELLIDWDGQTVTFYAGSTEYTWTLSKINNTWTLHKGLI